MPPVLQKNSQLPLGHGSSASGCNQHGPACAVQCVFRDIGLLFLRQPSALCQLCRKCPRVHCQHIPVQGNAGMGYLLDILQGYGIRHNDAVSPFPLPLESARNLFPALEDCLKCHQPNLLPCLPPQKLGHIALMHRCAYILGHRRLCQGNAVNHREAPHHNPPGLRHGRNHHRHRVTANHIHHGLDFSSDTAS